MVIVVGGVAIVGAIVVIEMIQMIAATSRSRCHFSANLPAQLQN
jgi:hypothetical protein